MALRARTWSALAILAVVAAGGYTIFETQKHRLPGLIQDFQDPVQPHQYVQWNKGADAPAQGNQPPNIILILVDDLGFNDISLNGGGLAGGTVKTPNIDRLAQEGANFTTAYAANATCSPSRAAMMTGRYPTRFGFEFTAVPPAFARGVSKREKVGPLPVLFHGDRINNSMPAYADMGVPASEITIAETLKSAGYHTVHIGKWHLGEAPDLQPQAQGFDESLAVLAGAAMFMEEDDPKVVNAKLPWDPIDRFLWANLRHAVTFNGGPRFQPQGHMTDYFAEEAMKVMEANKNRPFFLFMAFNAPHTPLQATRADYDALSHIKDHKTRVYAAMVAQLDRRIGDMMEKLKALGLDDNSLILFTSDNGGAWYAGIDDLNAPYRGWKATFYDGGLRTPLFLRWPAKIAAGTKRSDMTGHLDIYATIAAAAGATMPQDRAMDGYDILAGPAGREAMFWRSGDYRAVRQGDWKLHVMKRPDEARLYNLANDPQEKRNLAGSDPARVAAMRQLLAGHDQQQAAPIWPGLVEAPVRLDVPSNAPWKNGQEYIYWTN